MLYRTPPEWRQDPGSYWEDLAAIRRELRGEGQPDRSGPGAPVRPVRSPPAAPVLA